MELTFTLNGEPVIVEAAAEALLVDVLRDHLGLTGTKRGCDTGTCGACSVLLGGRLSKSCRLPLSKVAGREVITIEGIHDAQGDLDDVQRAFLECGAVQCGFCTPGMVLAGEALLLQNPSPTREEIRKAINGNLCRCTGYKDIVDAIEMAAVQRQRGEMEHFPVLLEKWRAVLAVSQEDAGVAPAEVSHA
ncbi:MAG: (2Fe-2S)-binding protein [Anaerolineae bacterium]|jgi:carbon-monoxide dehydrogenase small subunit|nr:(2Fe-2S)-binding protein [Anaerolineae bacterium]